MEKRMKILVGIMIILFEAVGLANNFGYKLVGGMQRATLSPLKSLDNSLQAELAEEVRSTPQMKGYLLGVTVYYQPSEVPLWVGGYFREKSLRDLQGDAQNQSHLGGVEVSVWYPHPMLQPYFLLGGGLFGKGNFKSDYETGEHQGQYSMEGKNSEFHSAIGIKMPSSPQLAAYVQWEIGYENLSGDMTFNDEEQQFNIDGALVPQVAFRDVGIQTRNYSLMVGIDCLLK